MQSTSHTPPVRTFAAVLLALAGAGCSGSPAGSGGGIEPELREGGAAGTSRTVELPSEPKAALALLRSASSNGPVAVFKHSPICPISAAAEERFHGWLSDQDGASPVAHAQIDVLAEKPLARGLVAELGIKHESPQVLLFQGGELVWHASHHAITGEALSEQLGDG